MRRKWNRIAERLVMLGLPVLAILAVLVTMIARYFSGGDANAEGREETMVRFDYQFDTTWIVPLIVLALVVAYGIRVAPWKRGRPRGPMI